MILTRRLIENLKTVKGGFNYATLSALGVKTPPTSGWINNLIGTVISEEEYEIALQYSKKVKRKKLPNHDMIKPMKLHIVFNIKGELKEYFKYWRLDVAELVLNRMGSTNWEIGINGSPNLAKMVEDMRDIQKSNGNASKQEQAVDNAIKQIRKYE